jgi:AcrR family transcriptional regulator
VTPVVYLPDGKVVVMTTRTQILDGALQILRAGGTVTLESAARQAGLTKPGLMYHFSTKQALMLGLVDHVIDGYEQALAERLSGPVSGATTAARIGAYLDWCLTGAFDQSDLAMFTDPRLCGPLTDRWAERMGAWLAVPPDVTDEERARLNAVRLIADGSWFADATGVLSLGDDERAQVRRIAAELMGSAQ